MRKLFILISCVVFLIVGTWISIIVTYGNTSSPTQSFELQWRSKLFDNPQSLVNTLDSNQLDKSFPFTEYSNAYDWSEYENINRLLSALYTVRKDDFENQHLVSVLLTDSLASSLDSINSKTVLQMAPAIIRFAEKQKVYAAVDKNRALLFESVYQYWMNRIQITLKYAQKYDNNLKYRFEFLALKYRLEEQKFRVPTTYQNSEKIIMYILDGKWSYLLYKLFIDSSFTQKTFLFLVILLQLYLVYHALPIKKPL